MRLLSRFKEITMWLLVIRLSLFSMMDSTMEKPLNTYIHIYIYIQDNCLFLFLFSLAYVFCFPQEWKIGPTVLTLCEHLFVSFSIRMLRKQAGKLIGSITWKEKSDDGNQKAIVPASHSAEGLKVKFMWRWGIGKFVLSGIVAYIDGRLCRSIPNPLARRIVSGFLLSFLEKDDH